MEVVDHNGTSRVSLAEEPSMILSLALGIADEILSSAGRREAGHHVRR